MRTTRGVPGYHHSDVMCLLCDVFLRAGTHRKSNKCAPGAVLRLKIASGLHSLASLHHHHFNSMADQRSLLSCVNGDVKRR